MNTINTGALVSSAPESFNNKNESNMKMINIWSLPFSVKGNPVMPGETFEEEGQAAKELIGNDKAVEATKENLEKYSYLIPKKDKK